MSKSTEFGFDNALNQFEFVAKNKPNDNDSISNRTATSYKRNIKYFVEWLADERDKGPLEADTTDLKVYLTDRKAGRIDGGDGDKDKTIVTRRSAISRFYDELPNLANQGRIDVDPENCPTNPEEGYDGTWTVKSSHKEKKSGEEIAYLEPQQVKSLWQNVPAPLFRNKLIVRMLYQTGLRVGELIQIRVDQDMNRTEREITISASTSKSDSRKVVYKTTLQEPLRRWIDGGYRDSVPNSEESPYLFPTVEGEHEYISRESVRRIVRKAAENAGMNHDIYTDKSGNTRTKISPHILRHSMAVNTLKAGTMNVRELQEFLGHSELGVTETYLKIASDSAVDTYRENGGPPEGD